MAVAVVRGWLYAYSIVHRSVAEGMLAEKHVWKCKHFRPSEVTVTTHNLMSLDKKIPAKLLAIIATHCCPLAFMQLLPSNLLFAMLQHSSNPLHLDKLV